MPASFQTAPVRAISKNFPEAMFSHGEPNEADTADLHAAITAWESSSRADGCEPLEQYLQQHPDSAWNLALQTNLGILNMAVARFGRAAEHLEASFVAGKDVTERHLGNPMGLGLIELPHLNDKCRDAGDIL